MGAIRRRTVGADRLEARHAANADHPLARRGFDLPERLHAARHRCDGRAVDRLGRRRCRAERRAPPEEDHRADPQGGRRQVAGAPARAGRRRRRAPEVDDGGRPRPCVADPPRAERGHEGGGDDPAPAAAGRAAHRAGRPDRRSPARSTHRRPGRGVAPPGGAVRRQGWQAAGAGELPRLQADVGRDAGVGDRAPASRGTRRGSPSCRRTAPRPTPAHRRSTSSRRRRSRSRASSTRRSWPC